MQSIRLLSMIRRYIVPAASGQKCKRRRKNTVIRKGGQRVLLRAKQEGGGAMTSEWDYIISSLLCFGM
jgi:hypothetical protein